MPDFSEEAAAPQVGVVVVNYNGGAMLLDCLSSVQRQDYHPFTLILVDNGSTDGSLETALVEFPRLHAVRSRTNLGFAEGNNLGFQEALRMGCAYVCLINNDAVAEPSWLQGLVRAAEEEEAGICGGKILTWDTDLVEFAGKVFEPLTTAGGYTDQPDGPAFDQRHETAYACGASMLIRASVLERIGGFDKDFFAYHEDVDLSLRAWVAGYRVLYVPDAVVRHRRSQTGGSRMRDYFGARNALTTVLKCYQWSTVSGSLRDLWEDYWSASPPYRRKALRANLARLPRTLMKRWPIQRSRRMEDREVLDRIARGMGSGRERLILSQDRGIRVPGELLEGGGLSQEMLCPADGLGRVDLFLGTYARENQGRLVLRVREALGDLRVIREVEIPLAGIRDNGYQPFHFEPIPDSGGERYYLELLSPGAEPGNAVTVWYHPRRRIPGGRLRWDGREIVGVLRMQLFQTMETTP